MSALAETAYAKINLALHVRARRPDGYHELETLFAFCRHGDGLEVRAADDFRLRIEGPFALGLSTGEDNLVMRAARALAAAAGERRGAALTLHKRLPVASGIGGGSADAAATLRLLPRLWGCEVPRDELLAIAAGLGADVPSCLDSRVVRAAGRGDRLDPADDEALSGCPVLLVNPGVALQTADVFARWGGVDRGPMPSDPAKGRNDLEAPAVTLQPSISCVLALIKEQPGVTLVRMSGSGATCFGLFADAAARDRADAAIAAARPDWWRLASELR